MCSWSLAGANKVGATKLRIDSVCLLPLTRFPLFHRPASTGPLQPTLHISETVPTLIRDIVSIGDEEKLEISQLNYPMRMPLNVSHQLAIVAPHGSFLSFESKTLKPCPSVNGAAVRVLLTDVHNASYPLQLCSGSSESHYTYESVFHTLELTYEQVTEGVPIILGRIRALRGIVNFHSAHYATDVRVSNSTVFTLIMRLSCDDVRRISL